MILALPRSVCHGCLSAAIVPFDSTFNPSLVWRERAIAEEEPAWQQIIPYATLVDEQGRLWAYRRTGGDRRLRERRSIGVGGHIEAEDDCGAFMPTVLAALHRELGEELLRYPVAEMARPKAWINEQDSSVGRVHLGLVFALTWNFSELPMPRPGEGLEGIGFMSPADVTEEAGFEAWSVLAARALENFT
jgi:predicted NUDIX family phosphoesterase